MARKYFATNGGCGNSNSVVFTAHSLNAALSGLRCRCTAGYIAPGLWRVWPVNPYRPYAPDGEPLATEQLVRHNWR